MHDRAEGVDRLTLKKDVDLDQIGGLVTVWLVVERGVSAGLGLQLVEEVEHDLGQRQRVAHLDALLGEVVHPAQGAAPGLAQLHHRTDELARHQDRCAHHRFADVADLAAGELAGVGHGDDLAVVELDLVDHVGQRRDQLEVELTLEPLPDDLQMQHAQEADPETEPERDRRLGLVDEGGIVELEPVQGVTQLRVVRAVDGVQAREHHRLGVAVTAEVLDCRLGCVGDRVAHPRLPHVLHAGDEITHLTDAQPLADHRLGRDDTDLEELVRRLGRHHQDLFARVEVAVHDAHVGHDTAVRVIHRVEDHRPRRGIGVAHGCRQVADDLVQQRLDAEAGLARHLQTVLGLAADQTRELLGILLRLGGGQVDLVQHRNDREVVLHRQIEVRQRLGLDALGGVHEQDRTLAGSQRSRYLVGEVHMARRVDHVQAVGGLVDLPRHPHGLGLDGDATLALDVHPVEVLGAHRAGVNYPGDLQHPVSQGRLAVVDVGDDAEVPDEVRRRRVRLQRVTGLG